MKMFKKLFLSAIALSLVSFSFATSNGYEIVVAALRYKSGIDKIRRKFKNDSILVYKKNNLSIVAIGIFNTKDEAKERLKSIKKIYPSAFIRGIGKKTQKRDEVVKNRYVIQIAVLSKEDGVNKIKNQFKNIDIKVNKVENLYRVFTTTQSKKESIKILKQIHNSFPSAFIVGEKTEKSGYIIFVGRFEHDRIDSLLSDFINEESYVKKEDKYDYFYIVNIPSKEEAEKKLQSIKQKYPDAKTVSSLYEKTDITTDIKEEPKDENNITKLPDIKSENNTTETNITSKKVEEVLPHEFKEVDEENKTVIETVVREYKEKKAETPINSTVIRKIRKNYVDFDKAEYK